MPANWPVSLDSDADTGTMSAIAVTLHRGKTGVSRFLESVGRVHYWRYALFCRVSDMQGP